MHAPRTGAPGRGRAARRAALLLAFALLCGAPRALRAQDAEVPVPVPVQITLFLKVVTFDRQLAARSGSEIVVAVAYQSGNRASLAARDEALAALAAYGTVDGRPVRVRSVDLDRVALADALAAQRVLLLYVAPLRAMDVADVAAAARLARVTTVTGVPGYVAQGLAVGVRLQGDRPRLLINLEAARREGADFRAELLKLAQVVR